MRILIFVFIFLGFYPVNSMAIEEPAFTVEKKFEGFEIRQYGPVLAAQTENNEPFGRAGNAAFRVLADYIFGNNKSKTKIAMTSPVTQQSEKIAMTAPVNLSPSEGGFVVQFMMPAEYTRETLPEPVDPRVQIVEIAPRRVAVYSYSGSWSEKRFNQRLAAFHELLAKESLQAQGEPIFARFNSPLRPWFLRRNEIWIELAD